MININTYLPGITIGIKRIINVIYVCVQDEDYYSDEEDTYYNDDDYYKENVTESSLEPYQTSDDRI